IGPDENRFERYATHAAESDLGGERSKDAANPRESKANPPHIIGWKECEAKAALYAHEAWSADVRHAHGVSECSPGPSMGKSAPADSSPPLGQHLQLILGPPGTGKTTRLLGLLGDVLQRGTGP